MVSADSDYHRLELSIASDPHDSRRVMPHVEGKHRRILDVGCGAGQTLIGSKLPKSVFAVGLDNDPSALSLGKQFSAGIDFVSGQGETLPFKNGTFDLVICRVALPYMHISRALSEMSRVTRPEGDLWLVLHPLSLTVKELGTNIVRFQARAGVYRLWVMMNGLALHFVGKQWSWPVNPHRYESSQTKKSIKRALLAAGFDRVNISRENHFVVTAVKR
jgi:ubiquinone/menaquinone biosynthesis C-methylase UbiE